MQAIILAAGSGTRLGNLTTDCPKALVKVCGRELILRVKDFLDHPEITEKIIVTGFGSNYFVEFLEKNWPEVKTVHNPNFRDGSVRTIEAALPFINSDFLIINTDHIYPKRMLKKILENGKDLTAVCDFDRALGPDDMKIKLNKSGYLARIKKTLNDFDGGYIGMTFCPSGAIPLYKEGVLQTRIQEGDKVAVEFVLGHLAKKHHQISICNTSGFPWLEVDTLEDLAYAERILTSNPDFLS